MPTKSLKSKSKKKIKPSAIVKPFKPDEPHSKDADSIKLKVKLNLTPKKPRRVATTHLSDDNPKSQFMQKVGLVPSPAKKLVTQRKKRFLTLEQHANRMIAMSTKNARLKTITITKRGKLGLSMCNFSGKSTGFYRFSCENCTHINSAL